MPSLHIVYIGEPSAADARPFCLGPSPIGVLVLPYTLARILLVQYPHTQGPLRRCGLGNSQATCICTIRFRHGHIAAIDKTREELPLDSRQYEYTALHTPRRFIAEHHLDSRPIRHNVFRVIVSRLHQTDAWEGSEEPPLSVFSISHISVYVFSDVVTQH